jgi:hypothetical protein
MLNFESSSFSRLRDARVDERRNSRRDVRASCRVIFRTIGAGREDTRLETDGAADGTTGTAMLGGGGVGILAALPMPLGSLTELLRPPALPGPRGMPLTPASCARDGAARQLANANTKNHDLPNIDHASFCPTKGLACRSRSPMNARRCLLFLIPVIVCSDNKIREVKMNTPQFAGTAKR